MIIDVRGKMFLNKSIDIAIFRKKMFTITNNTIRIWNDKKRCWRCKKKPKIGEIWGISINNREKNRIFCPGCAELVGNELKSYKLRIYLTEKLGK